MDQTVVNTFLLKNPTYSLKIEKSLAIPWKLIKDVTYLVKVGHLDPIDPKHGLPGYRKASAKQFVEHSALVRKISKLGQEKIHESDI